MDAYVILRNDVPQYVILDDGNAAEEKKNELREKHFAELRRSFSEGIYNGGIYNLKFHWHIEMVYAEKPLRKF